jgi:hypothetical protein
MILLYFSFLAQQKLCNKELHFSKRNGLLYNRKEQAQLKDMFFSCGCALHDIPLRPKVNQLCEKNI